VGLGKDARKEQVEKPTELYTRKYNKTTLVKKPNARTLNLMEKGVK
jgi:hypothetical protein